MTYKPVYVNAFTCYMWFEGDERKEPHRLPHNVFRYLCGYSHQGDGWLGYRTEQRAMDDLQLAMEKAK